MSIAALPLRLVLLAALWFGFSEELLLSAAWSPADRFTNFREFPLCEVRAFSPLPALCHALERKAKRPAVFRTIRPKPEQRPPTSWKPACKLKWLGEVTGGAVVLDMLIG